MMRVFLSADGQERTLGEMPALPDVGDYVTIPLESGNGRPSTANLLVTRRTFEWRSAPPSIDHELLHITPPFEWVCVLSGEWQEITL